MQTLLRLFQRQEVGNSQHRPHRKHLQNPLGHFCLLPGLFSAPCPPPLFSSHFFTQISAFSTRFSSLLDSRKIPLPVSETYGFKLQAATGPHADLRVSASTCVEADLTKHLNKDGPLSARSSHTCSLREWDFIPIEPSEEVQPYRYPDVRLPVSRTVRACISVVLSHRVCNRLLQQP